MDKAAKTPRRVGILALQGAYEAHVQTLLRLGAEPILIRRPAQLTDPAGRPDGMIIPGGESSTLLRHLERDGFFAVLQDYVRRAPAFGTCAGAILLAETVTNPAQQSLGVMKMTVERNSYGRQHQSTILIAPSSLEGEPLEMVFIRAPRITSTGAGVETLAWRDDSPVLVRQSHLLAATFHPELSSDLRVHQLFLSMIETHAGEVLNPPAAAGECAEAYV